METGNGSYLYYFGAHPNNNTFDGIFQTMASYHGIEPPDIVPGFKEGKNWI